MVVCTWLVFLLYANRLEGRPSRSLSVEAWESRICVDLPNHKQDNYKHINVGEGGVFHVTLDWQHQSLCSNKRHILAYYFENFSLLKTEIAFFIHQHGYLMVDFPGDNHGGIFLLNIFHLVSATNWPFWFIVLKSVQLTSLSELLGNKISLPQFQNDLTLSFINL